MTTYFAYGSNMLTNRLTRRAPGAATVGPARLDGFRLSFHKCGVDGSGKCSIGPAPDERSSMWGVLFHVPYHEHILLDRAESLGAGYFRRSVRVQHNNQTVTAWTYQAQSRFIDDSLAPFEWYHSLVLAGAHEHGLPHTYIDLIGSVASIVDPAVGRSAEMAALLPSPTP